MNIQLRTRRLIIEPIQELDLEKIHELHSLPETDLFNTLGIPENLDQTERIMRDWMKKNKSGKKKNFTFKVTLIESKSFIGLISLNLGKPKYNSAEVWYKYHPDFWNKGYATECLKSVLKFGFGELHLHRIEAGCAVENIGSIRTLEKAGMIREGRKRKALPLKNGWSDCFEYAILASDMENDTN